MEKSSWRKVLQKQIYDILSHRYGLLVVLVGTILIIVSAFHFGESVVEWSTEKYAAVFNSFSDNVAGRSFRERLCLPVPIDVVYTWVNGTDPQLIMNLKRVKFDMEEELNVSREQICVFSNCLESNIVVLDPMLPSNMTFEQLQKVSHDFSSAKSKFKVTSPMDNKNFTAVVFSTSDEVKELLNKTVVIDGLNTTVIRCHITSDWTVQNSVMLHDLIIMSGFPHTLSGDELKAKLPEKHQKGIEKVEVYSDRGIAILHVPVKTDFDALLAESNFTIEGKEPTLNAANLVWDLRDFSRDEDISASRFEDNEELRYSLRSIERFAPWVRHIYIVTNGQIPYWLNLENPRVTIVTHDEIFVNHSHLPSFSSPAIESNIHRIPGLSDKFIYMNDDVMFGKEVWPDDFYTYSSGQKVYLTWPVPNCNEGCPATWIKDGYCDKACNVSECEWDAGDCDGAAAQNQAGGWAGMGAYGADSKAYCHTGCANNWIADRYCDTSCNVIECGFDAGDCGTDNYGQLHGFMLTYNQTLYVLPKGLSNTYFNLSTLLSVKDSSIHRSYYDDNSVIRTVAVGKKFNVLTVVLHANMNKTQINFTVVTGPVNRTKELNFTLSVDTMPDTALAKVDNTTFGVVKNASVAKSDNKTDVNTTKEEEIVFKEVPPELQSPKMLRGSPLPDILPNIPVNLSAELLHGDFKQQYAELELELKEGELTESGFLLRKNSLWINYQTYLKTNHSKSDSVAVKQKAHRLVTSKSNPARKPTMKPRVAPNLAENMKEKLKSQPIVAQGHPGQAIKSGGSLKEAKEFPQRPIKSRIDQNEALRLQGQPVDIMENGKEAEVKGQNAEVKVQRQPMRSKTIQKEVEAIDEVGNKQTGGRQLLDVQGMNEIEFQIEEDDVPIKPELEIQPENGKLLPWERGAFDDIQKEKEKLQKSQSYDVPRYKSRRILDTFGDSLRHVNTLYNKAFGYTARKVPGHMPHMIDKNIMAELQDRFPEHWAATSSHKVRSSDDMQYAFAYFYYLMGVKEEVTPENVFDEMDTDKSKVLSDRELRTLATRLYDLPLDLPTLTKIEYTFVNCSKNVSAMKQHQPDARETETYYEKDMPQVTRNLWIHCPEIREVVKSKYKSRNKYNHITTDDAEIAFKMIKTNVSGVVGQLDDIRRNPKKFICLNDNIDHTQDQAKTVKAILQDFYESLFPLQSQFELPREYRNRFTHIDELREWRHYRDWLKFWTHIALALLVLFTVASFFADKIEAAQKRLSRRRNQGESASSANNEEGRSESSPSSTKSKFTIETV